MVGDLMVSIRMKAPRRRVALIVAGIAGAAVAATIAVVPAGAAGGGSPVGSPFGPLQARDDTYSAKAGHTAQINAQHGVLANDSGVPRTIVAHTDPANGTLTLGADGGFSYTPAAGFHGTDTFTYTVSDAV